MSIKKSKCFPWHDYLHTGEHQAITDKVGGVAHAFARFETERDKLCLCDLRQLLCVHQ